MQNKRYVIRQSGDKGMNFIATIPPKLIQAKAQQHGLSVEDFILSYDLLCLYSEDMNTFAYNFIKREVPNDNKQTESISTDTVGMDVRLLNRTGSQPDT